MIKKVFGLFVALSFVLILAACAEPSAIQKSFEEQALDYNIHLKALIQSGYLSTVDSYHPYTIQIENETEPKTYQARRLVFAYTDEQYNDLFLELGIKERDFYCIADFDAFMKNTILDSEIDQKSFPLNYLGIVDTPAQITNVPTLHGDYFTVARYSVNYNRKFSSGSIYANLDISDFLDENGLFTQDMYLEHIYEKYTIEELEELLIERAERTISLIDLVKYKFGYYYVPSEIFWPSGIELPEAGPKCSVSKLIEVENKTSAFYGLVTGASTLTDLAGTENYTTFAPSNDELKAILDNKNGRFTKDEATRDKEEFLQNHTVLGSYSFADLRDMAPYTLESLSGNNLYVVSDGTRVFINGYEIKESDMAATNGFVHELDGVLYRPVRSTDKNLVEVLEASDEFSVLSSHLSTLNLSPTLTEGDYTVIAPSKTSYEAWLSLRELSIDSTADHELITNTLLSHVIPGSYSVDQLLNMTKSSPILFETLAEGGMIEISQDASKVLYANGVPFLSDSLSASNGYVHSIDSVLEPEVLLDLFELITSLEDLSRFDELLDILAQNAIFLPVDDYTLFAPTNDAILDWMIETNIDIYSPNAVDTVYAFVQSHMASGINSRAQLSSLSANGPTDVPSLLPNVSITISQDTEGNLYANGVMVVNSYEALNGVIHTVNTVLLPDEPNTLLSVLTDLGQFSIFLQLMEGAGLQSYLTTVEGTYTVFAPTNPAFEALMAELQIDVAGLSALPGLEGILQYHIVEGTLTRTDLNTRFDNDNTLLTTLLMNRDLLLSKNLDDQLTVNDIVLLPNDGPADNGYVFGIGAVLMPEPSEEEPVMGNIIDVLNEGGVFTTLVAALETTGLDLLLVGTEPYTVFAPLDGYFMVKMIQDEITLETLLADPGLLEFLRSHIVLGSWDADSLKALVLSGQNIISTLNGNLLTISETDGYLFINGKDIIVPNMLATNGVVHSMAGFLVDL
ncbi:fasciclin domain-containing protein [Acholeplasma manati]|uniref:Fasciclin domain-containing protein n=1 Tax=Paracholeplasma manati TaxID=591373 RepID=A0ABT2Y511_9MOLU|nr:fasciclin domain-containing protein [Paracholeplasma manati]MCV2231816.1 fasciclin domain-containing protein [Paracholeplasma manati]